MDGVKKACTNFDAICKKVGRDPAEVQKSVSLRFPLLNQPSAQIIQHVKDLRAAGVEYCILSLFESMNRTVMQRFAKEVIPEFQEA